MITVAICAGLIAAFAALGGFSRVFFSALAVLVIAVCMKFLP
jgi:hypothetical protein